MIDDFRKPPSRMRARLEAAKSGSLGLTPITPPPRPGTLPTADTKTTDSPDPEPAFRTPEEVAGIAPFGMSELPSPIGATENHGSEDDKPHKTPKPRKERKVIRLFGRRPIKQRTLVIITVAILMLLGGAVAYYQFVLNKPEPTKTAVPTKKAAPPPTPPPITSPLTGLTVDSKEKTTWPVIGVMVENSPDARPQSGLKQAGVVFEAIAEAGITRFLTLYQEDRTANVGPIRSSRPYYLDWTMAFDASYAHVGGSPDALDRIKSIGVKDMDQFYNPAPYRRITTRYAPHNVYSTVQQLADLSVSKGWSSSTFTPLPRKADKPYVAPTATQPSTNSTSSKTSKSTDSRKPANAIDIAISGAYYNTHYDYDAATNTYKRFMAGSPHMDADSDTQLQPKVVVALVMPYSLMADGYHSQYSTTGTGKMFVFQDGTVTTGTWSKGEPKSQFEFKDDSGTTLKLNAGQTWISIVSDAGKVTSS